MSLYADSHKVDRHKKVLGAVSPFLQAIVAFDLPTVAGAHLASEELIRRG